MSFRESLCQSYADFAEGVSNTIRALAEPDYSDVSDVGSLRLEELIRVVEEIHCVMRGLVSLPALKKEDLAEALKTLESFEKRTIAEAELFKWGPWPARVFRDAGDLLRETLAASHSDIGKEKESVFIRHPHFFLGLLRPKRAALEFLSPYLDEWETLPKSSLDQLSADDLRDARHRNDITAQEWDDAVAVLDLVPRLDGLFAEGRGEEAIPLILEMRGASERSNLRSGIAQSCGYEAWVIIGTRERLKKRHYDRCWDLLVRALALAVIEGDLASCRTTVQGLSILYRDIGFVRGDDAAVPFSRQELKEKLAFHGELTDLNERCGEAEYHENLARSRDQIEILLGAEG